MRRLALTTRRLAAALAVAAVAVVVPWADASASPQPELIVEAGQRVHARYAPLVGNFNNEGNDGPYPGDCSFDQTARAVCDTIPLRVVTGDLPSGAHALLTITVSWDDQNGTNTLDTRLWAREANYSEVPVADDVAPSARPIKGPTIPRDGEQRITWVPPPDAFYLTVLNLFGANTGYEVRATVEVLHEPVPVTAAEHPPTPRPAHVESRTGDVPRTDSIPSVPPQIDDALGEVSPITSRGPTASIASRARDGAIALAAIALVVNAVMLARRRRALAGLRARYRDLRLFWKLLVPFVVAICAIGTAGTWLTVRYLADRAQQTLDSRLLESAFGATTHLRDQELYLLEAVRFAANVEGIADALRTGDRTEAGAALGSAVAVRTDLDVAAVTGLDGVSLVDYVRGTDGFTTRGGTNWSAAGPVKEVIAGVVAGGDKRAGLVLVDGEPLLVTAAPVRTDTLVGVAVAAIRADRLAAGAAERASAAVAIYDASGRALHRAVGFPVTPPPSSAEGPVRQRATVDGRGVTTLHRPVLVRGERIGTVAVRLPADSGFDAVRGAGLRIGALVAAAMLAIVAFGALVSRHILRSVRPLVDTNRALGRGDLSVRAPVVSGDELGELAQGFNVMAEQLQASYEQLERRVAERTEELSRLYEENVRVTEARSQLFAGISHELRTPLFAILANAEMLSDPELAPEEPEELKAQLATIDRAAKSLLAQVDEILELARAESAGVELHLRPVAMHELWADVERSIAALARASDLALHVDVPADLPPVAVDAERVRQIVLNLASNAVKYTPGGGSITVVARTVADAVELAVTDTGIGIPAEVGDDVFVPYYRVPDTAARAGWASTGLGLALTRRLVEAHGGSISYRDNGDAPGTTFRVSFPIAVTDEVAPRR